MGAFRATQVVIPTCAGEHAGHPLHACSALSMCRWVGSRPAPTIPASLLPRHANCPASAAWAPPLVGFNLTQPLLQAGAGAAAA